MAADRGGETPGSKSGEAVERAGRRVARNTIARAAGEIVGKLASLALFAVLARETGDTGLGTFILALAYVQLAFIAIDVGLDRWLLRQVARDRSRAPRLVANVIGAKVALAIPVLLAAAGITFALDYGFDQRITIYVISGGLLADSLGRTAMATLNAHERGDRIAITLAVQRITAAALGLVVLAAGLGVVAVAVTFSAGTALGTVLGFVLLRRAVGSMRARPEPGSWAGLVRESAPFAVQDIFTQTLQRGDAILLSVIATTGAVGRYGAAYRLLEATFFLTQAVSGAFAAMYAYLDRESTPTIGAAFERSQKLAAVLLIPPAIVLGTMAEPILGLIFGAELEAAAGPLRLLAGAAVLMGIVKLSSSLIASQRTPRAVIALVAGAVAVNVGLNVALIPEYGASGAAAAMLITEVLLVVALLVIATRIVGEINWTRLVAGPGLAASAMLGICLLLAEIPVLAVAAGLAAYATVLVLVERVTSPDDLRFVIRLVRGRLGRPRTDVTPSTS